MTTALVLTAIDSGDATTFDGIKLRLHVAGVEVPDLQNILDGLLFVGSVKRSFAPAKNAMVYELTNPPKWEPEGTTEIVSLRAKHPERKLDWQSKFEVKGYTKPKVQPKPKLDLEKEILAVIGHDGPSAIKIFHRIKIRLQLREFELNFYDVRTALDELKKKHLVGYVNATESTNGGWVQLRIPKAFQK